MTFYLKHLLEELYVPGFVSLDDTKPFRVPENFDLFEQGYGWSAYNGMNDWEIGNTAACVYVGPEGPNREQARIWFEIQYSQEHMKLMEKHISRYNPLYREVKAWGEKAIRRWTIETKKIHRLYNPRVRVQDPKSPFYNRKSWKECFIEALSSKKMKPFVKRWGVDHSNWKGMSREKTQLEETFKQGKGWFVHEGTQSISVIFENGKQMSFELSFANKTGIEKDKWRTKAASQLVSLAREIYNNPEINEIGNVKQKTWNQCFEEALNDVSMKPFIKKMEPVFDPINFTPRI